ncbi:MAG: hypothetical protein KGI73_04480 [Patescibacteria group bacterium]|nr:hypothetical protein [Patescibacteria group bacterium]
MSATAYGIYTKAHERALSFVDGQGRREYNKLRAAVVFETAAIDSYFRVKIISFIKKEREKKSFQLSSTATNLLKDAIALRIFSKQFKDLNREQKELITNSLDSNKPSITGYLEKAISRESFQSIDKIGEAFKVMGLTSPQEVWSRIQTAINTGKSIKKNKIGRPRVNRGGRKADVKIQLGNMFIKRHLIVHEADIVLRGRKSVGEERQISYNTVKRWLASSKKTIEQIDNLIS